MTARAIGLIFVRRLAALVVVLVLVSLGIFSLLYLAPGNIVQTLIGDQPATPQLIATLRHQYHLDQPFLAQFWFWFEHAIQLDFGHSATTGLPVGQTISERLGVSFFLGIYAFIIICAVGVPLGVAAALWKRSAADRGAVGLSVLGVSTPAFVTGILLLYFLAVKIQWFPAFGGGSGGFTSRVSHLTLPAITLALGNTAIVVKLTRVGMLEALDQDYVAFARARGLPRRRVITSYALRNALIPVVTASGLMLGYLLTAAVLVDVTFSIPGLGSLLVNSVSNKDVPTIQGIALVVAIIVVLMNLFVDLLYLLIDPRIRFEKARA
jgi:peptide/nickel transport system permease protein